MAKGQRSVLWETLLVALSIAVVMGGLQPSIAWALLFLGGMIYAISRMSLSALATFGLLGDALASLALGALLACVGAVLVRWRSAVLLALALALGADWLPGAAWEVAVAVSALALAVPALGWPSAALGVGAGAAIRGLWREVMPRAWRPLEAGRELFRGVEHLYDATSATWEAVWGEYMHTGYYPVGVDSQVLGKREHAQAQERMMDELAGLWQPPRSKDEPLRVLDVGCGVGGSSRFLYRRLRDSGWKASVVGITLSPYQCERARSRTSACTDLPGGAVTFQVANALGTPFEDASFHLVWSLESGEHMPGKSAWLQEVRRILRPGGTLLCATWCHREVSNQPLSEEEVRLLGRICKNYSLPAFVPLSAYGTVAKELGLASFDASQRSWTQHVLPFWPAVVRSAFHPRTLLRVFLSLPLGGWTTIKGAATACLMSQGFKQGALNFGIFKLTR